MNDMSSVIIPKSDQVNAEDYLAGPRTYTIEAVAISPGTEQPVSIRLRGEQRVFRPCKSMSRVLVGAWGADANAYIGRSLTLYCDPKVKWGGLEVGGIRISHMSDIERDMVMSLTATKGKRSPHQVKVLQGAAATPGGDTAATLDDARKWIADAADMDALKRVWSSKIMAPFRDELQGDLDDRKAALAFDDTAGGPSDGHRGETHNDATAATDALAAQDAAIACETIIDLDRVEKEWADKLATFPDAMRDQTKGVWAAERGRLAGVK